MFVFISGSVNNDNLVIPLCSLALLIMIRQGHAWQADEKRLMLGWRDSGRGHRAGNTDQAQRDRAFAPAALTGAWERGSAARR